MNYKRLFKLVYVLFKIEKGTDLDQIWADLQRKPSNSSQADLHLLDGDISIDGSTSMRDAAVPSSLLSNYHQNHHYQQRRKSQGCNEADHYAVSSDVGTAKQRHTVSQDESLERRLD